MRGSARSPGVIPVGTQRRSSGVRARARIRARCVTTDVRRCVCVCVYSLSRCALQTSNDTLRDVSVLKKAPADPPLPPPSVPPPPPSLRSWKRGWLPGGRGRLLTKSIPRTLRSLPRARAANQYLNSPLCKSQVTRLGYRPPRRRRRRPTRKSLELCELRKRTVEVIVTASYRMQTRWNFSRRSITTRRNF